MYSTNEWDQLKTVIIGDASQAKIPAMDISLRFVNFADVKQMSDIKVGRYPKQVIDQANEDLSVLCDFLTSEGVNVLRPQGTTPVQYYDYCPRDLVVVHGDKAIAAPMHIHARHNNYKNIQHHFDKLEVCPRYQRLDLYNTACVENPDQLALTEAAPSFDAANLIRANDDVLYLHSNSGNLAGANYLKKALGDDVNVHVLQGVYSYMHIDSTVAFLREGLMLCNPERITSVDVLPEPFRSWDVIWCPEPTDIGHWPGICNASKWVNMNLLSINENLAVLEENQHSLRTELEKHGIECAMLPMRQQRTLGGGFHCVSLDLERCGK